MTIPTAHQLIVAILWVSPAIQAAAAVGLVTVCRALRRDPDSPGVSTGLLLAIGAGGLILHAGYILSPLWWGSGRYLLGAATMLPAALLVVGSLAVVLLQSDLKNAAAGTRPRRRLAAYATAGLVALAYIGPLLLMLAAWV